MKCLLLLFALVVLCHGHRDKQPPRFPDRYKVEGVIMVSHAEIREPFTATVDYPGKRSRFDYYGDLVQTVQREDRGTGYKISYMTNTEGKPEKICHFCADCPYTHVAVTPAFPNLTDFKFVGRDHCPDWYGQIDPASPLDCDKWSLKVKQGDKEFDNAFWSSKEDGHDVPVHLKVHGESDPAKTAYDEYRVSYKNYSPLNSSSVEDETFDFIDSLGCQPYPGPGLDDVSHFNPIREFIEGHEDHHVKGFEKFKNQFKKTYKDTREHVRRYHNFKHNHRFIQSYNRANFKVKLAHNHHSDLSSEELKAMSCRHLSSGYNGGLQFVPSANVKVPESHDWRLYGAVTPVKDQFFCGSCWSFGTTGTLEGNYFVKTGHLVRLSEQQLIDCSWQQGDNGCDGGEDFRAYEYLQNAGGIALDSDYGPYMAQDGKCHDSSVPKAVQIDGFYNVTPHDVKALEAAIFQHGPVTAALNSGPRSFHFYSNGVYYDTKCTNKMEDLNHQILIVGFGSLNGERYWLIKNSHSTYWGNNGYILMSQRDNMCGVLNMPTFPKIKV